MFFYKLIAVRILLRGWLYALRPCIARFFRLENYCGFIGDLSTQPIPAEAPVVTETA
jgi:hypothetical protein